MSMILNTFKNPMKLSCTTTLTRWMKPRKYEKYFKRFDRSAKVGESEFHTYAKERKFCGKMPSLKYAKKGKKC